ncbi:MAG: zinc ribbon domain-containing protein [bacterium]
MPIYEYEVVPPENGCEFCANGFEFMSRSVDVVLERCPKCHAPVRKMLSAANVLAAETNPSDAKTLQKHGFTVYEKSDEGVYERTAGAEGPKVLKP